ncbi:cupin domain-containing protein [Solirubrobacter sp. CPCC 204708]|uniref:Cupin domain-containing protein n=1 Tax=Solirubrobacter deserti TaxID=2282478 RepID=A0ABT4RKZ9_9ACTN|nr:cupin domain-containing protein [Solirubrobacter deserti]MBE2319116.1 cupin domain-containing protein [Solirubrobacter deserti]MDA0139194.1 cupin domain-containing protein [Solirubrobacter deserti]
MKSFNVHEATFQYDDEEPEGYRSGYHRFGPELDGSRLGATVYEIPPGQAVCPYHWETEEEWLLVLAGEITVRHPDGVEVLKPGDVVAFADDESGAHKTSNEGSEVARLMMWSTKDRAGYCIYPDSDKVFLFREGGKGRRHRLGPELDYYDGELG